MTDPVLRSMIRKRKVPSRVLEAVLGDDFVQDFVKPEVQ